MKKLFTLILLLSLSLGAWAQQFEKNILGIRGGINVAKEIAEVGSISQDTDTRIGFHLGITDQILLSDRLPFYLEVGLGVSQLGGEGDGVVDRPLYIQIPVLVNYHFQLGQGFGIQPFAGVYYGLGVTGKSEADGIKSDMFGGEGFMRRSDFGIRLGAGMTYNRFYFGLQYDFGCLNIVKDDIGNIFDQEFGFGKLKGRNRCFSISVGYNF